MQKIFKIIRGTLVFAGWTWLFTVVFNTLLTLIWNFNFLSAHSWNVFQTFWNEGGVIKTTSDVLLMFSLILLPVFWFIGFLLAIRLNYINLFLAPFAFLDRIFSGKEKAPERIVIKNIKSEQQIIDEIKGEIESIKPAKAQKAENIRSGITAKLSAEIKKK